MVSYPNSEAVTSGIKVEVFPEFIPDQSSVEENKFFFTYRVLITNNSDKHVKLLKRNWMIINANGDCEEISGPGVVGYTPELEPGESFEYSSYCTINTNWGTMEGRYLMSDGLDGIFEVNIARFYLFDPEYAY